MYAGKSPLVRHSTTIRAFTVRLKSITEHPTSACMFICSYVLARYFGIMLSADLACHILVGGVHSMFILVFVLLL